jgi:hypothetical protein
MDFIERLFGISPDGGNGSLEALLLLAIAVAGIAVFMKQMKRRSSEKEGPR